MTASAQPPTIDEELEGLFECSIPLRNQIIQEMETVHSIRVRFLEAISRRRIRKSEGALTRLIQTFAAYEARVSAFNRKLATATVVDGQPINLNTRLLFAIYISELATQRDTVRALLQSLNDTVSSRRTQADAFLITSVNIIIVILTLSAVSVALVTYLDARNTEKKQAEARERQQKTLEASRRALEQAVTNLQSVNSILESQWRKQLEVEGRKPEIVASLRPDLMQGSGEIRLSNHSPVIVVKQNPTKIFLMIRNNGDAPYDPTHIHNYGTSPKRQS